MNNDVKEIKICITAENILQAMKPEQRKAINSIRIIGTDVYPHNNNVYITVIALSGNYVEAPFAQVAKLDGSNLAISTDPDADIPSC